MRLAIGLVVAALLTGCGMRNQVLQTEHVFQGISDSDSDDTITLANLASDIVVVTDYNMRQTITVTAPAGTYKLRGKDNAGGRYLSPISYRTVTLVYGGLQLLGNTKPESVNGGIFVDANGRTEVFWFWDSDTSTPIRVPAPNVSVDVRTETDHARIRARVERQEQERLAKAKQLEESERKKALVAALASAKSRDRVSCTGQQCERAFAQAQAYLLKQADMRIQVATATLIETYNATSDGQLQIRLLRVPTSGDNWEIVISAHCRDERRESEERCTRKLIETYDGFVPHMQRN